MKNGKAWGCVYEDGHASSYGWVAPEGAPIYAPRSLNKPTDVTYEGSPYRKHLADAQLVHVERRTTVIILSGIQSDPRSQQNNP